MAEAREDLVGSLTAVGFLAGGHGLFDEALTIFEGVAALRPESASPVIGKAVTHIYRKQPEAAVRILEVEGLQAHPNNADIKVFLGLSLRLSGHRGRGDLVLQDVLVDGTAGGDAKELAAALLADR